MNSSFRTTRVDVASSTVTYIGKAMVAANEADPVWQIQKLVSDPSGSITILYANGSTANNVAWSDRVSTSYY